MIRSLLLVLVTALVLPTAAIAWESGQKLSKVIFADVDTTENSALGFGEIIYMAQSIALSADNDDDEEICLEEFIGGDFGFAYLAEADSFAAVKRIMFGVNELDNNDAIDARESRLAPRRHFERADTYDNAVLTECEFLNGWTPIVMLRAGRGR